MTDDAEAKEREIVSALDVAKGATGARRILVADDHDVLQMRIGDMLTMPDYERDYPIVMLTAADFTFIDCHAVVAASI
tara:strand:+ start:1192 stop:1425 length:234 start_codon:yes stop_codon:yes gene_type:complete